MERRLQYYLSENIALFQNSDLWGNLALKNVVINDVQTAAERSFVSVATVRKHNTSINRKLEVSNREELMVYVDLFRRCGRLEELKNG